MLQGYNPFFSYGGYASAQPMLQQALMQQQAAAAVAMFGGGQPSAPGFGSGQPERMYMPAGMDPAMAMRSMQYVQAMAANAAMMGFQVSFIAASPEDVDSYSCTLGPQSPIDLYVCPHRT